MEVKPITYGFVCALALGSCATMGFDMRQIADVYVADFHSDDMERCRPADVDLSHSQAGDFFKRAKRVDRRTLHDHYNHAPCYVEGTLKYNSKPCDWEIRAGATGHIRCGKVSEYFACDNCEDLFKPKATP